MSGRSSRSTFTFTKCAFISRRRSRGPRRTPAPSRGTSGRTSIRPRGGSAGPRARGPLERLGTPGVPVDGVVRRAGRRYGTRSRCASRLGMTVFRGRGVIFPTIFSRAGYALGRSFDPKERRRCTGTSPRWRSGDRAWSPGCCEQRGPSGPATGIVVLRFLPLPPRSYLRWRLDTAYGDPDARPPIDEFERYLVWSGRMRAQMRRRLR